MNKISYIFGKIPTWEFQSKPILKNPRITGFGKIPSQKSRNWKYLIPLGPDHNYRGKSYHISQVLHFFALSLKPKWSPQKNNTFVSISFVSLCDQLIVHLDSYDYTAEEHMLAHFPNLFQSTYSPVSKNTRNDIYAHFCFNI